MAAVQRRRASEAEPHDTSAGKPPPRSFFGRMGQMLSRWLRALLEEETPLAAGPVAEELEHHIMVEDVTPAVAAEIEGHPDRYPSVKILRLAPRNYPCDTLAAHVLGYLGPPPDAARSEPSPQEPPRKAKDNATANALVGRMGVERQYERSLRSRAGKAVELVDSRGRVLSSFHEEEPRPGRNVVLTLDPPLQRTAEELLDRAAWKVRGRPGRKESAGGAMAVMDLRNGALLAAASAPRFDPNLFVGGDAARRAALLTAPEHPLFDRVIQMALPPGSVFKMLTAIALLESATVEPQEPFTCQGYLHDPGQMHAKFSFAKESGMAT